MALGVGGDLRVGDDGGAELRWNADPGRVYEIEWAADPSGPWAVLPGSEGRRTASASLETLPVEVATSARFYRVRRLDTVPPTPVWTVPPDGSPAARRDTAVAVRLADESGILPESIVLTVGGGGPVAWGDPRLTLTGDVLTYRPDPGQFLGGFGEQVEVRVAVADRAGNEPADLRWSFRLEREAVVAPGVRWVTGTGGVADPEDPCGLVLESVEGDVHVYRLAGDASCVTVGTHLILAGPADGFTRTVVEIVEPLADGRITVLTRPALPAELLLGGSLVPDGWEPVDGLPALQAVREFQWAGLPLDFSVGLGRALVDTAALDVRVGGEFALEGGLSVAAVFEGLRLTEFEAVVNGRASFRLGATARAMAAGTASGRVPVYGPVTRSFTGFIGPVPVWVELGLALDVGYEASFTGTARWEASVEATKDFMMGRRWDGSAWRVLRNDPGLGLTLVGPEWELEGTAGLRVFLQPRITLEAYGVAGLTADLTPHVDLTGEARLDPPEATLALHAGLDAGLAVDLAFWDAAWGALPAERFSLLPRTRLWEWNEPGRAPEIAPLADVSVGAGEVVVVAAEVRGATPMDLRWLREGVPVNEDERIEGTRSDTLRIRGALPGDSGSYTLRAENAVGSTNAPMRITVQPSAPAGMAPIPGGWFNMGPSPEPGVPATVPGDVFVSPFFMDRHLVTRALWTEVHTWAVANGYVIAQPSGIQSKPDNHPVVDIGRWHDLLKWCNARSEREGLVPAYYSDEALARVFRTGQGAVHVNWHAGYRLPTEAEWERAARGGAERRRFPWGDTISHEQANYLAAPDPGRRAFDVNPVSGYHPDHFTAPIPYSNPVDAFPPNAYGLFDMYGNVFQMCWDYNGPYSSVTTRIDPRGPPASYGPHHILRGHAWSFNAHEDGVAFRITSQVYPRGFRCVRGDTR